MLERGRKRGDPQVSKAAVEASPPTTDDATANGHGGNVSGMLRAAAVPRRSTRRDVLFRAGAAAVASVGALTLLEQRTAQAATGGNFVLGATNNANLVTNLVPSGAGQSGILMQVDGSNLSGTTGGPALKVIGPATHQVPAVYADGRFGGAGVVGVASDDVGTRGTTIGIGVEGAATQVDLYAGGSGRIISNGIASGPPSFGSFSQEQVRDAQGVLWLSNGAGGWYPAGAGGLNIALYTALAPTSVQLSLAGSNGTTWQAMDATNLKIVLTPKFHCQAIVSLNTDLWTTVAGYNQDIGVNVSSSTVPPGVGLYPTVAGQPEAWKESGGPAAFSPNAAYLQTILPMRAGVTYTLTAVWKANHAAPSTQKIMAGAGPIGGKYSPTRMTVQLVTDVHSNVGATPVAPHKPILKSKRA